MDAERDSAYVHTQNRTIAKLVNSKGGGASRLELLPLLF